ncbi:hypothetical protein [Isoptericola sp. G70]|uniref:hypothetical protein n=1 Tax=Isoptericola sp. G70 TaxID=3376633 RepID=UPI003A8070CD
MAAPTAQTVADYLGQGDDSGLVTLAGVHLPIVTAFIRAYTRGNGFDESGIPGPDIEAVITSATARLTVNPEQTKRMQIDDYSETPATLNGFTLPELAILHLYRRRTA